MLYTAMDITFQCMSMTTPQESGTQTATSIHRLHQNTNRNADLVMRLRESLIQQTLKTLLTEVVLQSG